MVPWGVLLFIKGRNNSHLFIPARRDNTYLPHCLLREYSCGLSRSTHIHHRSLWCPDPLGLRLPRILHWKRCSARCLAKERIPCLHNAAVARDLCLREAKGEERRGRGRCDGHGQRIGSHGARRSIDVEGEVYPSRRGSRISRQ